MKGTEIKLGYAPTRRSIFSAPDAIKYRGLTKEQLENIAALKVLCAAWRASTAAMPWPSSAGTPCKGSWASCPARPTPS